MLPVLAEKKHRRSTKDLILSEVQAVLTRLSKAVRASVFRGVGLCLAQHGPGPGGDQENNPLS